MSAAKNSEKEERGGLNHLIPGQAAAVVPVDNIWLSASAGTGKTQVLTARVIRLLLTKGVKPENLLCITFTKAGAAEMSERINRLLASWVQMKGARLATDLQAIGADEGQETQQKARRLFASVLDAPGGGLQILTIHSLCQSLLASFPAEAGIAPGFEPVEGREQAELYRSALADMIVEAEQSGRGWLIGDLQRLSLDLGEEATQKFLQRCASEPDAMAEIPSGDGAEIFVRRHLDIGFDGDVADLLTQMLDDSVINRADIIAIADMNNAWGTKTGTQRAEKIHEWLAFDPEMRAANFDMLHRFWSKANGDLLAVSRGHTPQDESYAAIATDLFQWTSRLLSQIRLAEYAQRLTPALRVGKAYAERYQESKNARGLVDFDDMIRKTAALLGHGGMADWVRYKLDQQIDHILVDEAQDTNNAQWDIVRALADDFFSGAAAKGDKGRTIFAVGDYKQAIFGFQGTDPENYRMAGEQFGKQIAIGGQMLQRLELAQSFRSTKPVLDFVNAVVAAAGPEMFGINEDIEDHYSDKPDVGMVELFTPVCAVKAEGDAPSDGGFAGGGDDEENWLSGEKRILSHRIAAYVRALVDEAPILATTKKPLVAGDIMILLRSRGEMASFLVGQLHDKGVPVAGIDRLRLQQPIAVQDMLSVVRFVLQPDDDLSLACILVSPLFGWSQDDLLHDGYRGPAHKGKSLWQFLKSNADLADDIGALMTLLAQADYTTVYLFLENILSGPMQGRKKFAARLGAETLVPIEELLNAALQFEERGGGGLQSFLDWFERGDTEIKREGLASANEVRVMTVHGSKGLQAPVVILADVTADPNANKNRDYSLSIGRGLKLPVLQINKADKHGMLCDIAETQGAADLNEHFRLLYVAMTRAQERLVMAGALGTRAKEGQAPQDSWYTLLAQAMASLGCHEAEDARWDGVMRLEGGARALLSKPSVDLKKTAEPDVAAILPEWIFGPAPQEKNPPRPLAPSRLDDDDYGEAPVSAAMERAAQKGRLIHALFERISDGDNAASLSRAAAWLAVQNPGDASANEAILADIRAVLDNPEWADFFGPDARAEVPLAAVVGTSVITGRVDRLYVGPDHIRLLDFKTGRNVPSDASALPRAYLRQMAHYVAALEVIFPGKPVEACLLFTHNARLMTLPNELLAPHRPGI